MNGTSKCLASSDCGTNSVGVGWLWRSRVDLGLSHAAGDGLMRESVEFAQTVAGHAEAC